MVESFVKDTTEYRVQIPAGYTLDQATMTLRPVDMHPSIEELRQAELARRQHLGVCADVLMGVMV